MQQDLEHYAERERAQGALLDQLHESVQHTRHYAVTIGDELREQDGMLDNLHAGIERAADGTRRQNQNVQQLLRDSKNRGFYCCVILLVVILILLLLM